MRLWRVHLRDHVDAQVPALERTLIAIAPSPAEVPGQVLVRATGLKFPITDSTSVPMAACTGDGWETNLATTTRTGSLRRSLITHSTSDNDPPTARFSNHLARRASRSGSQISTLLPSSRIQPRRVKSDSALLTVSRDAPVSCAISSWVRSWMTRSAPPSGFRNAGPSPAAAGRRHCHVNWNV
jgi:hypothetical protein